MCPVEECTRACRCYINLVDIEYDSYRLDELKVRLKIKIKNKTEKVDELRSVKESC